MFLHRVWFVVMVLSVVFVPRGFAADGESLSPALRLSQQFAAMQSMRGDFVQTIYDESGAVLQQASGVIAVKRPRLFYWRTQTPYEHLVVASGNTLWIYDIDLEQVSRRPFSDDLDRAPALILSGEWETLASQYTIDYREQARDGETLQRYSLRPLAEDNVFRALQLQFAGDKIHSMVLTDSFDQRTEILFSNVRYNVDIDPQLFQFSPPPGVDVIVDEP